jgi:hypothetical protein
VIRIVPISFSSNIMARSLTTAIKDDTSSIRRNIKGNAITLDQIAGVLNALPEQIALQLQGQTLRSNISPKISPQISPQISPKISTASYPPLLAAEASTMDSARLLESLFSRSGGDAPEPVARSHPLPNSDQIDEPRNPLGVGARMNPDKSRASRVQTPTEASRARRRRSRDRDDHRRKRTTKATANTTEGARTPNDRGRLYYPTFSKKPHPVEPLDPVQDVPGHSVPGPNVPVPSPATQQQSSILAEHSDVQEPHDEGASGTRRDEPEAAADPSRPPQTSSPAKQQGETQHLSRPHRGRDYPPLTNPKLLESVEDAIRNLILPELDALRRK